MKLEEFFATIAPMLDGTKSAADVAPALYGEDSRGIDAQRLAIYAEHCRGKRSGILESTYPELAAAVTALTDRAGWESLVDRYFHAHPMRLISLPVNGAELPKYLAGTLASTGLPPWIPELADLEWHEWQTAVAPTVPADAELATGQVRVTSTAAVHMYSHELVQWLDADGERPPAPIARASAALLWRDPSWCVQRAAIGLVEIGLLRAIRAGAAVDPFLARELEVRLPDLTESFEALSAMGVVLGYGRNGSSPTRPPT